eukprot:1189251-Prorocentrum_minimum.AAC.3
MISCARSDPTHRISRQGRRGGRTLGAAFPGEGASSGGAAPGGQGSLERVQAGGGAAPGGQGSTVWILRDTAWILRATMWTLRATSGTDQELLLHLLKGKSLRLPRDLKGYTASVSAGEFTHLSTTPSPPELSQLSQAPRVPVLIKLS